MGDRELGLDVFCSQDVLTRTAAGAPLLCHGSAFPDVAEWVLRFLCIKGFTTNLLHTHNQLRRALLNIIFCWFGPQKCTYNGQAPRFESVTCDSFIRGFLSGDALRPQFCRNVWLKAEIFRTIYLTPTLFQLPKKP